MYKYFRSVQFLRNIVAMVCTVPGEILLILHRSIAVVYPFLGNMVNVV
jgi:hypothetical protein